MSSPYPALRARFGDTDYFLTTMPIAELISRIVFPANLPEWKDFGIEEKFQRKLDMKRIKSDIAPYFAEDEKRFSGSLVLAVKNDEKMEFEPLDQLVEKSKLIPKLYHEAISDMGFFIMPRSAILIPLDGQHRAKAFELAVRGDGNGEDDSSSIQSNPDLGREKVSVILVRFEEKKARYIFNKINKYAKPTTKANKLITDDDDSMAVITRQMIRNAVIPERLVSLDKNALNRTAHEFTTLATFNDASIRLLSCSRIPTISKPGKLPKNEIKPRLKELSKEWSRLISGIEPWTKALRDPTEKGDETRIKMRKEYLSNRPIGQFVLAGGYALASKRDEHIDRDLLVRRLNRIDWRPNKKNWLGILLKQNGTIMAGTPAKSNAIKFIAYRIGAELTREEHDGLLQWIHGDGWKRKELPERIK